MARPRFPEDSLTYEERLDLVADLLLRGVTRLWAERAREKTRRWRERRAARQDGGPGAPRDGRHRPEEAAPRHEGGSRLDAPPTSAVVGAERADP